MKENNDTIIYLVVDQLEGYWVDNQRHLRIADKLDIHKTRSGYFLTYQRALEHLKQCQHNHNYLINLNKSELVGLTNLELINQFIYIKKINLTTNEITDIRSEYEP